VVSDQHHIEAQWLRRRDEHLLARFHAAFDGSDIPVFGLDIPCLMPKTFVVSDLIGRAVALEAAAFEGAEQTLRRGV
jgi:hypothetical protein